MQGENCTYSASIAVKAVIELSAVAFGNDFEQVKDLYGQVLVSRCHTTMIGYACTVTTL